MEIASLNRMRPLSKTDVKANELREKTKRYLNLNWWEISSASRNYWRNVVRDLEAENERQMEIKG